MLVSDTIRCFRAVELNLLLIEIISCCGFILKAFTLINQWDAFLVKLVKEVQHVYTQTTNYK